MTITPNLLEILCCPETHQLLHLADEQTTAALNRRIADGELKNLRGELVTEPIEGALVRADRRRAYLVRQDFPVMIAGQAVLLED